ncbi:ABC transporter substrate-binding protein [Pseudonocardia hydrocarbonoxydans]|uniref:ABC transporter periplasmic component n=1 Tax=Pseudonocardia hydrocarbonoxydans TaxID=76726 RepID=A0A4Y3WTE0_9PSEU|nr:iron-siderophore ABC transporter substrate-binding protein [Pseudonocardia hydrocarbonoxydans]GEC20616.1 ABC transporter periplasmic component [Pseudonocardia hydrocarbonoxydans]
MVRRPLTAVTAAVLITAAMAACGGPGAAPSPADGTRTVTHAMGTAEIAGTPERVVVLDTGELDTVLALGVTPAGAVAADATGTLQSYLGDRLDGVEQVGTIQQPDLEAIAALAPDLILTNKSRHEDIYDRLDAIAPTVMAERVGVAWRENVALAGEALGRVAEADAAMAEYRAKAQQTGARFGDPSQLAVSMVRFTGESIRLYGEASFIGTVLEDGGFGRPQAQQVAETFTEVSAEEIGRAEGDLVFYSTFGDEGATDAATVLGGPLWSRLAAVRSGDAHEVSDDLWYLGIGPIAAGQILDELATYAP